MLFLQSKEFLALNFALGVSVGILFTVICHRTIPCTRFGQYISSDTYMHSKDNGNVPPANNGKLPVDDFSFKDGNDTHHKGGDTTAKALYKKVKILCWIMTSPSTLKTKGQAVKNTWGKRCNKLIFMSSAEDPSFPAVKLNVSEGREHLWDKTRAAFKYIYKYYFNDYDWFLKADDDTFVIIENLRYFLSEYNSLKPYYFGRWFKTFGGYNSGGAGYVFSKKALKLFNVMLKNPWKCPLKAGAEDVAVGVCFQSCGVHPGDTRDSNGLQTFHPYALDYHFIPGYIGPGDWLHDYDQFPVKVGPECCSDVSTTFHYTDQKTMYILEYFLYHLFPYGIGNIG